MSAKAAAIRRGTYKPTKASDDWRRRREIKAAELSREHRLDVLKRRRIRTVGATGGDEASGADVDQMLKSIPVLVEKIYSEESKKQIEAAEQFLQLLSVENNPPFDEIIGAGVVPRFVEFLMRDDFLLLQNKAAWVLGNIASGSSKHTKVVVDHGTVPIFVKLLGSLNDDIREQVIWALGNISGDSPKCRDIVLANGALVPMLLQLNGRSRLSIVRTTTWALSCFCGGKPPPAFEQIKLALPALERLIHSNDEEVLTDACRALSTIAYGSYDKIQAVIEAGICSRLVELLLHHSPSVLSAVLRAIGNIATGDDSQTQYIINHGVLPNILRILTHDHKRAILEDACWIVSNITAGNSDQIQAVIDSGLIVQLLRMLHIPEPNIRKEAAHAISNAISVGTPAQIKYIVTQGCIKPVCELLAWPDTNVVMLALVMLENILNVGESEKNSGHAGSSENPYLQMISQAEGINKMVNLCRGGHGNHDVHEAVIKILENHFPDEIDDDMLFQDAI